MAAAAAEVHPPVNVATWITVPELYIAIDMKNLSLITAVAAACTFVVTSASAQYFNGYECIDDCSGHEAGYEWAEDNGIEDESDCGGNSESFIEGCYSYVEELEDEDDYDDDEERW